MPKLVLSLFLIISQLIFYPCYCMEALPNETIVEICVRDGVKRNVLALVCKNWHEKAIEMTQYIDAPETVQSIFLLSGKVVLLEMPKVFSNLTKLTLNNNIIINDSVAETLTSFTLLKALTVTFSNTMTDDIINKLTTLKTLKLESNRQITNKALLPLTGLRRLGLRGQDKVTKDSLQYLTSLTRLHMQGVYVTTGASLAQLTALKQLSLEGGCTLVEKNSEDLTDPLELKKLGIYRQSNITIADLAVLPKLTHLILKGDVVINQEVLDLFEGKIGDIHFIKKVIRE